ncbi:MAG TPA: APC family permease [Acidobacteriota bacterium]|nr:APC family permease [Acidobacteriota bacterium]
MSKLARSLRVTEYFTLAFGAMVGVGWLIVIDDWLTRGGPGGAMLGFLVGGLALLPVAYVYSRFVRAIPDAAAEIAYASTVFPRGVGFVAGWLMTLAYLIVCPWEAVAIGKLVGYLFSPLQSVRMYQLGGFPIYLPALLLGLGSSLLVAFLNYRGIRLSSRFLNYTTFGLLTLFALFCGAGLTYGSHANRIPMFANENGWAGILASVIMVLQIVPYFLTGFESVPKCAEEAQESFQDRDFAKAIFLGLGVGTFFYVLIIGVVSGLVPWRSIAGERYATAVAFDRAFHSSLLVRLIFVAAIFSLFKVFNANFLTASRLIFALGRNGLIPKKLGQIHPRFQSPAAAIIFCLLITMLGPFLGDSILIPVTEVGSLCSIIGWSITCISFIRWRRRDPDATSARDVLIALAGTAVALLLLVLKLAPTVPGSFGRWEYAALAGWLCLGLILAAAAKKTQSP